MKVIITAHFYGGSWKASCNRDAAGKVIFSPAISASTTLQWINTPAGQAAAEMCAKKVFGAGDRAGGFRIETAQAGQSICAGGGGNAHPGFAGRVHDPATTRAALAELKEGK